MSKQNHNGNYHKNVSNRVFVLLRFTGTNEILFIRNPDGTLKLPGGPMIQRDEEKVHKYFETAIRTFQRTTGSFLPSCEYNYISWGEQFLDTRVYYADVNDEPYVMDNPAETEGKIEWISYKKLHSHKVAKHGDMAVNLWKVIN